MPWGALGVGRAPHCPRGIPGGDTGSFPPPAGSSWTSAREDLEPVERSRGVGSSLRTATRGCSGSARENLPRSEPPLHPKTSVIIVGKIPVSAVPAAPAGMGRVVTGESLPEAGDVGEKSI